MNETPSIPARIRRSVRRLLATIDRAVAASHELERARDALLRESERLQQLSIVGSDQEAHRDGAI
jgi:hypothetical protein